MRSGIVLAELIVVLVLLGIIAAIAIPHVAVISDAAAVRAEAIRLVAAIDAARGSAIRLNTVATVALTASSYRVTAISGNDTVIAWAEHGPAAQGVALTGSGAPLLFGPAGLAMGASNRTITLSRRSAVRRVIVSRLGRITY